MKKNITINLFGQLYHIDEDAYELLKSYEDNMRRYFSAKEGGEEIIDDIEHRVAELLSELQTAGATAINIENVQDIIRRIGNPEQFDDNEADGECPPPPPPGNSGSSAQDTESNRRRRLFRDPQDAMIGGINSGLAHFLNIENPAILRLLWVVLFFLSGSTAFFLYLILWIVVPAAVTPEERLRMKGQPVNPQTLNEEIIHAAQDNYGTERSTAGHSLLSRLLDAVLKICALLFKLLAFLFLGLLLVVAISIITLLVFLIMGGAGLLLTKGIGHPDLLQFGTILNNFTWETCAIAIGCFIVVALPLMALYRLLSNGNSNNGTGRKSRIAYLIVWIASLIITLILMFSTGIRIDQYFEKEKITKWTRNGVYLKGSSWAMLDEQNWSRVNIKNASPYLRDKCEHLFIDDARREAIHIEGDSYDKAMSATLQRSCDMAPGTYYIEAIVSTDGDGCYLFTRQSDTTQVQFTPIPFSNGNTSLLTNISWEKACHLPYFQSVADEHTWKKVQERSDSRNWRYVRTPAFHHAGGQLEYGLSNDPQFTQKPWNGHDIRIYDIVVTRTDSLPATGLSTL